MADPSERRSELGGKTTAPWVAMLETFAVALATMMAGGWLRPHDPFFVDDAFSWPVIAPLLMGLRYGFGYGFGCALLLIMAMALSWRQHWVTFTEFPSTMAVGLLVAGMLAGEFADVWGRKLRRQGVVSDFRRLRLEEFARAYHLLKVSHDTLEQRVAGDTQNLREALQTLRRQLTMAKDADRPLLGLEGGILSLFSHYGYVQAAALFASDEESKLAPEPVASLGNTSAIKSTDPLIIHAVTRGALVSVRPDMSPAERGTELLAAIPLEDTRGRLWGILAVRDMLFIAFQNDNLKLLAVLGGHVADILAYGAGWTSTDDMDAPMFRSQLDRVVKDRKRFGLEASLVSVAFDTTDVNDPAVQRIIGGRRGLDCALIVKARSGKIRILLLLPFTDGKGALGYIARVRRMVHESGTDPDSAGFALVPRELTGNDETRAVLAELCNRHDVAPEGMLA